MKNDNPNTKVAKRIITTRPTELVAMLEMTKPLTYSGIESGVAKMLRKLRVQTSSKNARVTPCMTRTMKSHSKTAPSSAGTKLKPGEATEFRYLLMKPHKTISIATHTNNGMKRAGLPRSR